MLRCFWLDDDVGRRFKQRLGDLADHPVGDWIATYGDPAFTAATEAAKQTVNQLDRLTRHAATGLGRE